MKNIIILMSSLLSIVACSDIDNARKAMTAATGIPNDMGKMNAQMAVTNDAIHKQTLLLAITEMSKPQNYEKVEPVPTALMPAAQTFAETATTHELVELFYVWIKEIEEVSPLPNTANIPDANGQYAPYDFTLAEFNTIRKEKIGKLNALAAIAGFIPDTKVDAIINEVILESDRFQKTGLQILGLRAYFITQILLQKSLLDKEFSAPGMAEEAVKQMTKVESVLRLPFVSLISVKINTKDFTPPLVNFELTMDQDTVQSMAGFWTKILGKAQRAQKNLGEASWTNDKANNGIIYQKAFDRYQKMIDIIKTYKEAWANQP